MLLGRDPIFSNKSRIGVDVERTERDEFKKIACRDTGGDESRLLRKVIQEYIKSHAEGNDTFKLDTWNDDPDFKAVPTILSRSEIWYKYLEDCKPEDRLRIQIQANTINKQCLNINLQEDKVK